MKQAIELQSLEISPFEHQLSLKYSYEDIQKRIAELALQLEQDYGSESLCILAILKGALWLSVDLISHLKLKVSLETVRCSSYGLKGMIAGDLVIENLDRLNLEGQHILVVDDICDTGQTLSKVMQLLKLKNPKSLKSLVLLSKQHERNYPYTPDYVAFEMESSFVVGYGMDYREYYRGLRGIFVIQS